jgi:sugar lactone lactonase YvrE
MFKLGLVAAVALAGAIAMANAALGDHGEDFPRVRGEFSTVFKPPVGIEGLTADRRGNLYTAGRPGADGCSVFRVPAGGGAAQVVGRIPPPCGPAGLAFGSDGRLFIADGERIVVLRPDAQSPPDATVFATGVPGANGVAFDRRGTLWVSDGVTSQGRVWRVSPAGAVEEAFRVQPMANDVNVVNGVGGVGRDPRGLPPGTITITPASRQAANTLGSQHIVANGLAFGSDGTLYVADTARGAIWRVRLDWRGNVLSPMGCDTTFTPNTLCLDDVFVAHPFLEGADGIVLDEDDNIVVAANERNAIAVVTGKGRVVELFRSPVDPATRLRNLGPLEFPTSPVLVGRSLCVTNSDGGRRDNFPASGGDVGAKVNCARLS